MATLKWSNVTGANTDAGSDSLKNAGSLFSKAFENFSGAVEGRKKRETKSNTESLLNQIRNIGSREDLAAQEQTLGDLNARKEQVGGNLDTSAISKALFAKRGYLDTQEAQALTKENAAYQLQRGREADRLSDIDRVKQQNINKAATGIFTQQQAQEDANRAAYQKYAGQTGQVSVDGNVPVFQDIDAQNLSPQEYTEAVRQQQTFRQNIANDPTVGPVLTAKQSSAALTKSLIGFGASATQINANVEALKGLDRERTALSDDGKLLVAQQSQDLERSVAEAEQAEKVILDRALRDNPITHTLNAKGDAIEFGDVLDEARAKYPDSEWIGQGGRDLTGLIAKLKIHGVSSNGVIGTKGNKGLDVEPWMVLEGIKLFGQTDSDAIFNPTVDTDLLLNHISLLAKDPKYKQYAKNNRNATINYNKQMAGYTNEKVKGLRALATQQSKAEGKADRKGSAEFLRDAFAKYR